MRASRTATVLSIAGAAGVALLCWVSRNAAVEPAVPTAGSGGHLAAAGPSAEPRSTTPVAGMDEPAPRPVGRPVLHGRVVDAESGRAVPRFRVAYQLEGAGAGEATFALDRAHDEGRFRLDLPPGTYTVVVDPQASGFDRSVIHGVVVPRPTPLEVRVGRGAHVTGRVLDGAGRPVAGVDVVLQLDDVPAAERPHPVRARTDASGRYLLTRLAPGLHKLVVAGPCGAAPLLLAVDAHSRIERDLHLAGSASLTVEVLDDRGRHVAGAVVSCTDDRARQVAGSTTDGGIARFSGLPPGRFALAVRHRGSPVVQRDVEVRGDHTQRVILRAQ